MLNLTQASLCSLPRFDLGGKQIFDLGDVGRVSLSRAPRAVYMY
jgi:hypothetical protein